jgi:hypothetical protein
MPGPAYETESKCEDNGWALIGKRMQNNFTRMVKEGKEKEPDPRLNTTPGIFNFICVERK